MNVLILGGDLRYLEIINNLRSKYSVTTVGYKNTYIDGVKNVDIDDVDISIYDVIVFPINGVMDKFLINCRFNNVPIKLPSDLLIGCKKDALIFSGISSPNLEKMLNISGKKCIYMMKDYNVIKENAIPTVEGIIADAINNTDVTLNGAKVLVFGYGNIGSVLVKYLNLLGADVRVFIIDENDKKILDGLSITNYFSNDYGSLIKEIGGADLIINTVPTTVIDNSFIKYINRDCYVIDIASHPHGIDREVLDEFFIKNKLYLGIPGKVAPKTSGKILSKKINEVMGDV